MKKLLVPLYACLFLQSVYGQPVVDATLTLEGQGGYINIMHDNPDTNPPKLKSQRKALEQRAGKIPLITCGGNFGTLPHAHDVSISTEKTGEAVKEILSYNDGDDMRNYIYEPLIAAGSQQESNLTLREACINARLIHTINQAAQSSRTIDVIIDDGNYEPFLNIMNGFGFKQCKEVVQKPNGGPLDITQALKIPFTSAIQSVFRRSVTNIANDISKSVITHHIPPLHPLKQNSWLKHKKSEQVQVNDESEQRWVQAEPEKAHDVSEERIQAESEFLKQLESFEKLHIPLNDNSFEKLRAESSSIPLEQLRRRTERFKELEQEHKPIINQRALYNSTRLSINPKPPLTSLALNSDPYPTAAF